MTRRPPPSPSFPQIEADDSATIDFYGTNLTSTLMDPNYDSGLYSLYEISGMLADGTLISDGDLLVLNNSGASFAFLPPSAVPEPSPMAMLALILLVPLARRARRYDKVCHRSLRHTRQARCRQASFGKLIAGCGI